LATSRRQAWRNLASVFHVVLDRIPTYIWAIYAVSCRRRDVWRDAQLRFSTFVFSVILRVTCAKYGAFWRRCVCWRRELGVGLLASVVWRPEAPIGFIDVHSRRRADRRSDSASVFQLHSMTSGGSSLNIALLGGVATIGVPKLGVGLSQSLHMAS
jgi:hypothetical protein